MPTPQHTPKDTDSCQLPTMIPKSIIVIVASQDGLFSRKKNSNHAILAVIAHIYPIWHVGIILVMKHSTEMQMAVRIPAELFRASTLPAFPKR